jgi:glycosyltransferase involved in cell wall biosynthesis
VIPPGPKVAARYEPASTQPWFSVTMTIRNNVTTIRESLGSILPQLEGGGELVVVDAESTDGTKEFLDETARTHSGVTIISLRCNRGVGRNRAVAAARAPIVLTQVDADNRYADGVFGTAAERLRAAPKVDVVFAVGATDNDPSTTRFYAWRREAFDRAGGYPDTQEREDPPLLLRAFRALPGIERLLFSKVADDLKPRQKGRAPTVGPWRRRRHSMWAARKFRIMGFRFPEYARLLWLTRRTPLRFVAGLGVGMLAYLQGAAARDGPEFLMRDDEPRPGNPGNVSIPPGGTGVR